MRSVRHARISWLLSREYALIKAHPTNIPARGYNLMPTLEGVNIPRKVKWHPPA
jgi:hypothetical protein